MKQICTYIFDFIYFIDDWMAHLGNGRLFSFSVNLFFKEVLYDIVYQSIRVDQVNFVPPIGFQLGMMLLSNIYFISLSSKTDVLRKLIEEQFFQGKISSIKPQGSSFLYLTLNEFVQEKNRIEEMINFQSGSQDSQLFYNIIYQLITSKDDTLCYLSLNLLQQFIQTQELSPLQMKQINDAIFSRLKSLPPLRLGTLKKIFWLLLRFLEKGVDKTLFLDYSDKLIAKIRLNIEKDINYALRFRESLEELWKENYMNTIKPELLELRELFNWKFLSKEVSSKENLPLDLKFHLTKEEKITLLI